MEVKLTKKEPSLEGYYFVKFDTCSGLHLVEVKIVGNRKEIFADNCLHNAKSLYFHEFPDAWWSEEPVSIIF